MGRRTAARAAGSLLLILVPGAASAHGRFPEANEIVFSPQDPSLVLARTTFALLPSKDNGVTWRYLCLEALGLTSTTYEDPELAFTASGVLVAGLLAPATGLDMSTDVGCSWSCAGGPLQGQQIVDAVVRPDAPHHVAVLASSPGEGGTRTQVFESGDDGASWAPVGTPFDPTLIATGLAVAASDATLLYVSGMRGYGAARTASLFTWTIGATAWVEHPITPFLGEVSGGENAIYMGAVDPTDSSRIYLRSSGALDGGESRLYLTTDGGATFRVAKDFQVESAGVALAGQLLGFALSPDGSRIFVGTKESGLWSAARSDMAFTQVNAGVGVQCLATRQTANGPELWACGNEYKGPPGSPGNFIVGRSLDDGVTFEAKLPTLTSFAGVAQCAAPSGASMACGATASTPSCGCDDYQSFCSSTELINACLGCGMDGADAGAVVGATDAGGRGGDAGSKVRASSSSCACDAAGAGGASGAAASLALAVVALVGRRGARTRRTRPRSEYSRARARAPRPSEVNASRTGRSSSPHWCRRRG